MAARTFRYCITGLFICLMCGLFSGCSEAVCPANARQMQHRQLTKINKKRKRVRGLFPKAMKYENRKRKAPKRQDTAEDEL